MKVVSIEFRENLRKYFAMFVKRMVFDLFSRNDHLRKFSSIYSSCPFCKYLKYTSKIVFLIKTNHTKSTYKPNPEQKFNYFAKRIFSTKGTKTFKLFSRHDLNVFFCEIVT